MKHVLITLSSAAMLFSATASMAQTSSHLTGPAAASVSVRPQTPVQIPATRPQAATPSRTAPSSFKPLNPRGSGTGIFRPIHENHVRILPHEDYKPAKKFHDNQPILRDRSHRPLTGRQLQGADIGRKATGLALDKSQQASSLNKEQRRQLRIVLAKDKPKMKVQHIVDFNPQVGMIVPSTVVFYDLPPDLFSVLPQPYNGYRYVLLDNGILLLVEPWSHEIIDIIQR